MDFADWLQKELDKRNWKQADLAKRASLGTGTVSRIMNKERAPGAEACLGIAEALRLPPEIVFRKAGLLPERGDPSPAVTEIVYLFNQLDDAAQEEALVMMRGYLREKLRLAETTTNPSPAEP